jgi:transcriptional regulator with XRE-family HTH domain
MTNLETIRRNRNLQQQELADSAGVPQATVSRAENGKGITIRSAMRIVRALSLTVEEVFGDVVIDDDDVNPTLRDEADETSTEIVRPSQVA